MDVDTLALRFDDEVAEAGVVALAGPLNRPGPRTEAKGSATLEMSAGLRPRRLLRVRGL